MSALDQVMKLKRRVDRLRAASEQAKGEAAAIRKTLKADWKCESLADAKKKLEKMTEERDSLQAEYEEGLVVFREKWIDELQAID